MEHRRPNGDLSPGYFCCNCGGAGMSSYGHFRVKCLTNSKLVKALNAANPPRGVKPRYILDSKIWNKQSENTL